MLWGLILGEARRARLTYVTANQRADAGLAGGRQTVVADQPQREARQDRRQDRDARPLCHVPDGRGRGAEGIVPGNPAADRSTAATTGSSMRRSRKVDAADRQRKRCALRTRTRCHQRPGKAWLRRVGRQSRPIPSRTALNIAGGGREGYCLAKIRVHTGNIGSFNYC